MRQHYNLFDIRWIYCDCVTTHKAKIDPPSRERTMKSIKECGHEEHAHGPYKIDVFTVPPTSGDNHIFEGNYDDQMIDVPKSHGSVWAEVYDQDGEHVGRAALASDGQAVRCDEIHVNEGHRGRGIANKIYDIAEDIFGCLAVPSDIQLDDGWKIWARRSSREKRMIK